MSNQNISEIQPNTIIGEDHTGSIYLPSWKGFEIRNGTDSNKSSNGIISTHIIGHSVDYVHILSEAQYNAIKYLRENDKLIQDTLLDCLLNDYPNMKKIYGDSLPRINETSDYQTIIELSFLHIMDSEKDGYAYFGFELDCAWDEEHGIGIMMHKNRIIDLGQADESFNHLSTYQDNGTSFPTDRNSTFEQKLNSGSAKKWWEFWK